MVLSNLNSSVDVEARAMATMGDTLGEAGAECEGPGGVCRRGRRGHTQPCVPLASLAFSVRILGFLRESP